MPTLRGPFSAGAGPRPSVAPSSVIVAPLQVRAIRVHRGPLGLARLALLEGALAQLVRLLSFAGRLAAVLFLRLPVHDCLRQRLNG